MMNPDKTLSAAALPAHEIVYQAFARADFIRGIYARCKR